jgi:hypothetical protein
MNQSVVLMTVRRGLLCTYLQASFFLGYRHGKIVASQRLETSHANGTETRELLDSSGAPCVAGSQHGGHPMVGTGTATAVCNVPPDHCHPRAGGRSLSGHPWVAPGPHPKLAVRNFGLHETVVMELTIHLIGSCITSMNLHMKWLMS